MQNFFSNLSGQLFHLTKVLEDTRKKDLRTDLSHEELVAVIKELIGLQKAVFEFLMFNQQLTQANILQKPEDLPESSEEKAYIKQLEKFRTEVSFLSKRLEEAQKMMPEIPIPKEIFEEKKKTEKEKDSYKKFRRRRGGDWKPL